MWFKRQAPCLRELTRPSNNSGGTAHQQSMASDDTATDPKEKKEEAGDVKVSASRLVGNYTFVQKPGDPSKCLAIDCNEVVAFEFQPDVDSDGSEASSQSALTPEALEMRKLLSAELQD
mmetsp:Transcript_88316/g.156562  ORF Transcript_88316/g.156562 Transcript_88316/m.156562 type:complete len:119 (-) Transcript_88316:161-517(-)|eukprot:CAMPEP_0197644976 /NCGR_PEP_ID=MMETSP1338-20131121/17781_1 /TAXON_ID=43686 ORGANISM="Pelagodinium beii, Strain RCC1491" /NCGR_SAMPLE_ID=MMETSP1338 /ASSEMBLY_ACC=CAM_ASM_000754 /LENGTH=118 /DNA_ID=CAMNT_0043218461 /DNA_START=75 /DNA_END=431 /DNA_ORIENTATION=-